MNRSAQRTEDQHKNLKLSDSVLVDNGVRLDRYPLRSHYPSTPLLGCVTRQRLEPYHPEVLHQ
jgi:hypothetical protein